MRGTVLAAVTGMALAGAAGAAPLDADEAKAMLYDPESLVFYPVEPEGIGGERRANIEAFQASMGPAQLAAFKAQDYGYYGAMAVSVAEAGAPVTSVQLHSPAAAQTAALEQCEADAGGACTLIGLFVPDGYRDRDLTLSAAATAGVMDSFGTRGPRYLAYSPATAGFAVVKGPGADGIALDTCNEATNGRDDCVIGVAEE